MQIEKEKEEKPTDKMQKILLTKSMLSVSPKRKWSITIPLTVIMGVASVVPPFIHSRILPKVSKISEIPKEKDAPDTPKSESFIKKEVDDNNVKKGEDMGQKMATPKMAPVPVKREVYFQIKKEDYVKYLKEFIKGVKDFDTTLKNNNLPELPTLSNKEIKDLEAYLDDARYVRATIVKWTKEAVKSIEETTTQGYDFLLKDMDTFYKSKAIREEDYEIEKSRLSYKKERVKEALFSAKNIEEETSKLIEEARKELGKATQRGLSRHYTDGFEGQYIEHQENIAMLAWILALDGRKKDVEAIQEKVKNKESINIADYLGGRDWWCHTALDKHAIPNFIEAVSKLTPEEIKALNEAKWGKRVVNYDLYNRTEDIARTEEGAKQTKPIAAGKLSPSKRYEVNRILKGLRYFAKTGKVNSMHDPEYKNFWHWARDPESAESYAVAKLNPLIFFKVLQKQAKEYPRNPEALAGFAQTAFKLSIGAYQDTVAAIKFAEEIQKFRDICGEARRIGDGFVIAMSVIEKYAKTIISEEVNKHVETYVKEYINEKKREGKTVSSKEEKKIKEGAAKRFRKKIELARPAIVKAMFYAAFKNWEDWKEMDVEDHMKNFARDMERVGQKPTNRILKEERARYLKSQYFEKDFFTFDVLGYGAVGVRYKGKKVSVPKKEPKTEKEKQEYQLLFVKEIKSTLEEVLKGTELKRQEVEVWFEVPKPKEGEKKKDEVEYNLKENRVEVRGIRAEAKGKKGVDWIREPECSVVVEFAEKAWIKEIRKPIWIKTLNYTGSGELGPWHTHFGSVVPIIYEDTKSEVRGYAYGRNVAITEPPAVIELTIPMRHPIETIPAQTASQSLDFALNMAAGPMQGVANRYLNGDISVLRENYNLFQNLQKNISARERKAVTLEYQDHTISLLKKLVNSSAMQAELGANAGYMKDWVKKCEKEGTLIFDRKAVDLLKNTEFGQRSSLVEIKSPFKATSMFGIENFYQIEILTGKIEKGERVWGVSFDFGTLMEKTNSDVTKTSLDPVTREPITEKITGQLFEGSIPLAGATLTTPVGKAQFLTDTKKKENIQIMRWSGQDKTIVSASAKAAVDLGKRTMDLVTKDWKKGWKLLYLKPYQAFMVPFSPAANGLINTMKATEAIYHYDGRVGIQQGTIITRNADIPLRGIFALIPGTPDIPGRLTYRTAFVINPKTKQVSLHPDAAHEFSMLFQKKNIDIWASWTNQEIMGKTHNIGTGIGFKLGPLDLGFGVEATKYPWVKEINFFDPKTYFWGCYWKAGVTF